MYKKIKQTIEKFSMLKKGDKALCAVSGGPDSVCLLLALNFLKKELGVNLYAAHLNHRLRGAESDRDEHYVERLTRKLNIPLLAESRDTVRFAKDKKLSIEQAARDLRYGFLLQVAKNIGANKIATGHTKDDQAETLLMRLLRGAGLRGLRAIPPKRELSENIVIIRPLIETEKKEIVSFLKKKGIRARLDSTNTEPVFFRNKLRHNLLPHIEKYYSPKIKQILARTAESLDADYDYLFKQQLGIFKKIAKIKKDKCVSLQFKDLKNLPLSLKRGLVRLAIENIKGDLNRINYKHWQTIEDLILKGRVNSIMHLPGDINVIKAAKTLQFVRKPKRASLPLPLPILLKVPGITQISKRLYIKSSILKTPPKVFSASKKIEYFDADRIELPLIVRYKKPGDRMKPLGMNKYKRLQDIFVDDKIGIKRRRKIPIIADLKDTIMWLCGARMSDDFKVTLRTRQCLRLEIRS